MTNEHIDAVLAELAETTKYLRESGRLMREAVQHLIEAEERFEKTNRYLIVIAERTDKAISAALKAREDGASS